MRHVPRRMNIFARKMLKVSRLRNLKGCFGKLSLVIGHSPFAYLPQYILFAPQNFVYPLFSISTGYYSRPRRN